MAVQETFPGKSFPELAVSARSTVVGDTLWALFTLGADVPVKMAADLRERINDLLWGGARAFGTGGKRKHLRR